MKLYDKNNMSLNQLIYPNIFYIYAENIERATFRDSFPRKLNHCFLCLHLMDK